LRKIGESGAIVSARIAMAAARGLLLAYDRSRLAEYGRPVVLSRHWAYSLFRRMQFVKRKATTSESKHNFEELKDLFWMKLYLPSLWKKFNQN